jgi:hypothetical protein
MNVEDLKIEMHLLSRVQALVVQRPVILGDRQAGRVVVLTT